MSAERPTGTQIKPDQLLADQNRQLEAFFGHEISPEPPKELIELIERTNELGFTFEPHLTTNVTLSRDSQFPGWRVKPNSWFFDQAEKGKLANRLTAGWSAMEAVAKPAYDRGRQLYEGDPLAPVLEVLRKDGLIEVPDWCKNVPTVSRFGISPKEFDKYVAPTVAEIAKVDPENVRMPCYIEWNYVGNLTHPEWGETNTLEWFDDTFGRSNRLYGGDRDFGGLAVVSYDWSGRHYDDVAFRLQVDFPSKP